MGSSARVAEEAKHVLSVFILTFKPALSMHFDASCFSRITLILTLLRQLFAKPRHQIYSLISKGQTTDDEECIILLPSF